MFLPLPFCSRVVPSKGSSSYQWTPTVLVQCKHTQVSYVKVRTLFRREGLWDLGWTCLGISGKTEKSWTTKTSWSIIIWEEGCPLTQIVHRNSPPPAPSQMTRTLRSAEPVPGPVCVCGAWMMAGWHSERGCSFPLSLDFNSRFSTCSALRW